MLQGWIVIAVALGYIGLLFVVASYGDRTRRFGREGRWRFIYPLSLAIYCTSWTFFGSVGLASRTGFDFLTIYIGPMLLIGLCSADRADRALSQGTEHHVDRRFHCCSLRQSADGRCNRSAHRDCRHRSLHSASAQGGLVLAGDDSSAARTGQRNDAAGILRHRALRRGR